MVAKRVLYSAPAGDDEQMKGIVKNQLRAEMAKRGLTYRDLAEALRKSGVEEEERNLRNKVARGSFTAAFLLQCLWAMNVSRFETGYYRFEGDPGSGELIELDDADA